MRYSPHQGDVQNPFPSLSRYKVKCCTWGHIGFYVKNDMNKIDEISTCSASYHQLLLIKYFIIIVKTLYSAAGPVHILEWSNPTFDVLWLDRRKLNLQLQVISMLVNWVKIRGLKHFFLWVTCTLNVWFKPSQDWIMLLFV